MSSSHIHDLLADWRRYIQFRYSQDAAEQDVATEASSRIFFAMRDGPLEVSLDVIALALGTADKEEENWIIDTMIVTMDHYHDQGSIATAVRTMDNSVGKQKLLDILEFE